MIVESRNRRDKYRESANGHRPTAIFDSISNVQWSREDVQQFIVQWNNHHPTIKFKLKFQKQKQLPWIPTYTKAIDSKLNQFLMWKHISSQLRHFSLQNFPRVTHWVSREASLKEKLKDFFAQTLLESLLNRTFRNLKLTSLREATQKR